MHSGQVCISTSRLIVQRSISEKLISAVVNIMRGFRAGDYSYDPKVKLAALYSENHAKGVVDVIAEAVSIGAKVALGDGRRDGAVVQPHVLLDVRPGMRLWDRETFAPGTTRYDDLDELALIASVASTVLSVAVVDTVDEAVKMANASDYSLGATLWTKDLDLALGVANRVHSGDHGI